MFNYNTILTFNNINVNFNYNVFVNLNTEEVDEEDIKEIDKFINLEYGERKKLNTRIEMAYSKFNIDRAEKLHHCWTHLEFYKRYGKTTEERLKKDMRLVYANSCKVRLCPACAWRRSLKIFKVNKEIFNYIKSKEKTAKFIFLTLTLKNCYADELEQTIDLMLNAFNKMTRRKVIKQAWRGYIRTLEINYTQESNTFHPHLHILILTSKNYFNKGIYLKTEDYANLFGEICGVNYTPITYVELANKKSLAEISKYCTKFSNIFKINNQKTFDYVVQILDTAFNNRRTISYGFLFKDIKKQLKLSDEITDKENVEDDIEEFGYKIIYDYYFGEGYKRKIKK